MAPGSDANLLPLRYGVLEMLYKTAEKTYIAKRRRGICRHKRQRRPTLIRYLSLRGEA